MRSLKTVFFSLFLSCSLLLPAYQAIAQTDPHKHDVAGEQQARQTPADRPWLGITVQDLAPEKAKSLKLADKRGVLVSSVMDNGPADKAGIAPGDVILKLNGTDVGGSEDFINRIQRQKVGDTVNIQMSREGALKSLTVELGAMPEMLGRMSGPQMGGMTACADCPMTGGMTGGSMMMGQNCPMHGGPGGGMSMMRGSDCPMGMQGGGGKPMGGMMGGGNMMMTDGRHFDKIYMMIVRHLDLNADQKKRADALKTDFQKKAIRAKADIKIAEVELKEMLAVDPVNLDKVKQKVSDTYSKKAEHKLLWIRTVEDFKKILTLEQKDKLKDLMAGGCPGCPQNCPMMGGAQDGPDESDDASRQ